MSFSQPKKLEIFSTSCIQVDDLDERARVNVMSRWWKDCYFPPLLLWCGIPRSRRAGIQIDSIERSLIVPLRPARKLKLMMDWGREWETHREQQTGRGGGGGAVGRKEVEKKHGKWRVKTESGGDRWENTRKGKYWSPLTDGELLFAPGWKKNKRGLGSRRLSDDPSLAGSRGKGGQEEGKGRRQGGDGWQLDQCQIISYGWVKGHNRAARPSAKNAGEVLSANISHPLMN